jgi:radical SAM superfamily enzyme YgiQ (UPF0313 family)
MHPEELRRKHDALHEARYPMNISAGQSKRLRVLLVASPKTDLGFGRAMRLPNLGLNSIAANTDRSICDVKVLDLVVAGRDPHGYLRRVVREYKPDIVGLSTMTFQYREALELARIVKSICANSPVILGGYHATVASDLVLSDPASAGLIDACMRNEGEIAFRALIAAIARGDDYRTAPNLSYVKDGAIVDNPAGGLIDLEHLALPDRSSRMISRGFHLFGYPADVVETSRGCAFDCDFCSIHRMYGNSYRKYSFERVVRDIRDAQAHGARGIFIADDNITLDGNRYAGLCRAIIDAGMHTLGYFIQASVRGICRTPGIAALMHKAGVRCVFLGIENILQDNRAFLDKADQFESSDAQKAVAELRGNGIVTIGGFIIGNPDDTVESMRANYDFARKAGIDVALFFILTPFPGTAIREKLMRDGLVTRPFDFDDYTCFRACVKTRHVSSEDLFSLREEMGFRYPLNSGTAWRLARMVPPRFLVSQLVGQLITGPAEVFGYLKGLRGGM